MDVFETPAPSDTALVSTNLRMSQTRPTSADRTESTFVVAQAQIRFVRLPTGATATVTAPVEPGLAVRPRTCDRPRPRCPGDCRVTTG